MTICRLLLMSLYSLMTKLGYVYVHAYKTYVSVHPRYLSVESGLDDTGTTGSSTVLQTPDSVKAVEEINVTSSNEIPSEVSSGNLIPSPEEKAFLDLLLGIAPDILPENTSILLAEIPADVKIKLFAKNVKFKDKVAAIKNYVAQPLRTALVEKVPTAISDVKRHEPVVAEAIVLLWAMTAVVAVFPEFKDQMDVIVKGISQTDGDKITAEKLNEVTMLLQKMRGTTAAVSAVVSAALKVFYTVDGMAFDEFSLSLTALEWEIITKNMNEIRLKYAEKIRNYSTEKYHFETSSKQKLKDKIELDESINKDRNPLVKIMKLTAEDLHYETQIAINAKLSLSDNNKKIRFDRKALLSEVKKKVLEAYRAEPRIDVLKYVRENPMTF